MKVSALLVLMLAALVPVAHADEDVFGKNVGSYYMGATKFNVNQIPGWQTKIYESLGIPFETRLMMRTANQLECGDPDGFCIGLNAADAGPFQINRIHREDYAYSAKLVKAGIREREKAKLTGDWKSTVLVRDELFRFQANWTWLRMKRLAIQYERKTGYSQLDRDRQVWYQAVWHNGNTKIKGGRQFRFFYGDKAVKHWRVLRASYFTENVSLAGQVSGTKAGGQDAVKIKKAIEPQEDREASWFPELEAATPVTTMSEAGVSFSFP